MEAASRGIAAVLLRLSPRVPGFDSSSSDILNRKLARIIQIGDSEIWLSGAIRNTSHKVKVSAKPCTGRGTAHTPSSGVAETWLHETAVRESGYGDFALMSAVVGSDGVSLRRDDSKIRDEPCSPETL